MQHKENLIEKLKKIRFTIAGAARSGLSCAKLLKKYSAQAFVTEEKTISKETENTLTSLQIPFEQGGHSFQKIMEETDVLIISPGILLSSPLVMQAKQNNIPVLSEIEVASWFFPNNIVCFGITGTNGKSTTTHYLASLLQQQHCKATQENNINPVAFACGNIGKSVSEVLLEIFEKEQENNNKYYLSIELSSYQLETIYSLRPHCTCLLNLQNDHLARYESMDEYLKAKWRLILLTRDDGLAIIEHSVLTRAIKIGLSLPKCKVIILSTNSNSTLPVSFEKNKILPKFIFDKIQNGVQLPLALYKELKTLTPEQLLSLNNYAYVNYDINKNSTKIKFTSICTERRQDPGVKLQDANERELISDEWNIENSCLNGLHNAANILTASLMANFIGIDKSIILKQWKRETTKYIHLPHRLEIIGKEGQIFIDASKNKKHVVIINDSKATNVESTLVALKSFHVQIRLLLGGEPKGDSYLPIGILANENKIKIYPFGKAANVIVKELKNYLAESSVNMLAAANKALLESKDGDIILLSPACASFDEFKDFEHRGNVFREWAISHFG